MAVYTYKATDLLGQVVEGSFESSDEKSAVGKLHDLGLIPIRILPYREGRILSFAMSLDSLSGRITSGDVLNFTQELSTLLNAGLPLDRSLQVLVELTENKRFKKVVENILKAVEGGSSLAEALAKHPKQFFRLYTNMVRAGEAGGVLELIFKRLSEYLESIRETRDYILSASIYPIILALVGAAIVVVMLVWVIPKFEVMFKDLGQSLPLTTEIILGLSQGFVSYWWLILAFIIGGFIGWKRFVSTEEGRIKWDTFKFRIGPIRTFIQKSEVVRFTRTLGTLTRGGVPILEAMAIVQDTMGNMVFAQAVADVRNKVKEGESIARPMRETGVFPPLSIHIITVGEETGKLDEMLLKVADSYEKEVKNSIKKMLALFEPIMILVMAMVAAFIIFSILMAIFSVYEMSF
ncbi:MAG TPA: type II secretion system F family protein [Thermodesulfobacteriota bacterium]|nr:type II secretion system F family protein [Thermodesulfobacteriota bacterium]